MNSKKKTLILIGVFAFLMIAASVLYSNLSKNYTLDSLVIENNTSNNTSNNTTNESNNKISGNITNEPDNKNSDTAANKSDSKNSDTAGSKSDNPGSTDESPQNPSAANNAETSSDNSSEKTSSETETKLTKAPNFTVYDLAGNEVNLTDFFGKPVIVNFWASWCGPCQMEMPDFNNAYTTYKDEIEFLIVNMTDGSRETVEIASSFIEEKGYTFPVYYDTEYSAAITYSVSSLPTTYFIDADGNLIAHARGAIDADTLQRGIDMIYN